MAEQKLFTVFGEKLNKNILQKVMVDVGGLQNKQINYYVTNANYNKAKRVPFKIV